MNLQKYIPYLLAALFLLTFTACEDDDDAQPSNVAAMLTNGVWIGVSAYKDGNNMTQEYADQNLDIRKLEVVFSTNGRVSATYNDGRPDVGIWRLVDENTIMFEENTPNETEGEILLLTESELRVKGYVPGLELRFVKKEQ